MAHVLILSPGTAKFVERCLCDDLIKVFPQKTFLSYSKIILWAVRHGFMLKVILIVLKIINAGSG